MIVRPVAEGWQIISGHHRIEGARRAGLDTVPAWVREMDDEEAFMQLVVNNAQGELSRLEIGMHALKAVPLAVGGRGQRGGIAEYAIRIGYTRESVSQWRSAAQVAQTCKLVYRFESERTFHLYEISRAPRESWPRFAEWLESGEKRSRTDVAEKVSALRGLVAATEKHPKRWFPVEKLAARILADDRQRYRPTPTSGLDFQRSVISM